MKILTLLAILVNLLATLVSSEVPLSTNTFLSQDDVIQLTKNVKHGFASDDLPLVNYAVLTYKLTDTAIPKSAEICKYLITTAGDGSNLTPEKSYYITSTWNTLAVCQPLPIVTMTKKLSAVIEKDNTSIVDLYYAVSSLTALSQKLSSAAVENVVNIAQAVLKKNQDLLHIGYAFHVASDLGMSGSFALEYIKDVIAQADEVNGYQLQFEGGLSVTSNLINGIYRLSTNMRKKSPLTTKQLIKFANYFLSRMTVQMPKGIVALLSSIKVLATNEYEKPVCIALAQPGIVSTKQPVIRVRVCDILGKPLPSVSVSADSIIRIEGNGETVDKKMDFQTSSDKSVFTLNLMESKLSRGFYNVSVSAGSWKNQLPVKVLTEVVVEYLDIGTADADQTTQPRLERVEYPNSHTGLIEADYQQKLVIRFLLKDSASKKAMRVHQAFVRLTPVMAKSEDANEVIFVAEPDSSHVYKFDMPLGTEAKNFEYLSGEYNVELIIGDALVDNSFRWKVGKAHFKFPGKLTNKVAENSTYKQKPNVYEPQAEIRHMFREPEKRPPTVVSNLFTGLCLAPVILLFIIWAKLGVNISNFPFSLSAIMFHGGLTSIFVLFGIFWLKLDMFVTLRYLIGLGIVTFFAGNKLLSHVAQTHKSASR